jgi:hypothetical protein
MPAEYVTSIVEGQDFYITDIDPNAVVTAKRGSLALRQDDGNVTVYINTTVGVTGVGSTWVVLMQTGWAGISQILLRDNATPALDIGSTGLVNLLRFITANGAEKVQYRGAGTFDIVTGGLNVVAGTVTFPQNTVDIATAAIAALAGSVTSALTLRVSHPGGAAAVDTVLPVRTGGWRVLDAMVVATAAGGGAAAVQVQTSAAAPVSSNLVIDGAVVAGSVVRTTSLLNTVFASGATIKVQGVNAPAASNVFITLAPL